MELKTRSRRVDHLLFLSINLSTFSVRILSWASTSATCACNCWLSLQRRVLLISKVLKFEKLKTCLKSSEKVIYWYSIIGLADEFFLRRLWESVTPLIELLILSILIISSELTWVIFWWSLSTFFLNEQSNSFSCMYDKQNPAKLKMARSPPILIAAWAIV